MFDRPSLQQLLIAIGISVAVPAVLLSTAYYGFRADDVLGHGPLPSSTSGAGAFGITVLLGFFGAASAFVSFVAVTQTRTLTGRFAWLPYVLVMGFLLLVLLVPLARFGSDPWAGLPDFLVSVPTQLVASVSLGFLLVYAVGPSLVPLSWRGLTATAAAPAQRGSAIRGLPGRFTPSAWRVLSHMQEEAKRFEHGFMGTEHMVLGMVRERQGLAARSMVNLGVDLEALRSQMEGIIGRRGSLYTGSVGLTRRCRRVIEHAARLARDSSRRTVGTGHLLHSMMIDPEDAAGQLLESMGASANRVADELRRLGYDTEEAEQ